MEDEELVMQVIVGVLVVFFGLVLLVVLFGSSGEDDECEYDASCPSCGSEVCLTCGYVSSPSPVPAAPGTAVNHGGGTGLIVVLADVRVLLSDLLRMLEGRITSSADQTTTTTGNSGGEANGLDTAATAAAATTATENNEMNGE